MKLFLTFIILVVACGAAAAQGGTVAQGERMTGGSSGGPEPSIGRDPAAYSRSVTGRILSVDSTSGSIMIQGSDKSERTFVVDAKVQLKADKDSAMGGKKVLTLSDFAPGQVVKISYRVADNKTLAVRLKRARS
jgi:hypothetical protein